MPYNEQLTNLDRSVMPGNIKLRLWRINLAIDTLKPQFDISRHDLTLG